MSVDRRQPRAELKRLMVEAGLDVLRNNGLHALPEAVTYAAAFEILERDHGITVFRAQVHRRIWDSIDDYRRDVVRELLVRRDAGLASIDEAVLAIIDRHDGAPSPSLIDDLLRDGLAASQKLLTEDRAQQAMYAVQAFRNQRTDVEPDDVDEAISSIIDSRVTANEARYRSLAELCGVEPDQRSGMTDDQAFRVMTVGMSSLLDGLARRSSFDVGATAAVAVNRTDDTGAEDWTPAAAAMAAMLDSLFTARRSAGLEERRQEPTGPA